jgi:DNA polymerase-3 subunit delta
MELRAAELGRELARGLAPIYLVAGDELLLVQEACDAIVAAARAAGYTERTVLHADTGFDWNEILQESASLSLFAERRIIDVRLAGSAFGREGAEVLTGYARQPGADVLLLIRSGRLDGKQRNAAWYKALAQAGVVVPIWPVTAAELPRWLEARLQAAGLRCSRDALQALAQRVEGNLLAAVQEIEKLRLHELPQPIALVDLLAVLEDSAHYDTFELIDAALAGDAARVSRMVTNLRQEGIAVFAVLGALVSQLRRMGPNDRLPPQRQRLVGDFLRRVGGPRGVGVALSTCALIDAQGKGEIPGDPWRSLEELLLRFCGVRLFDRGTGLALLRARL